MPENIGYQFNRLYPAPIETYRQVNTITNRNAIPAEIRWRGMQVHVISENMTYELVGGIENSNWINAGETPSNPITHFKGFFNATTVTPAISNLNGIEGDEYKVTNGGVNVDFGSGDIFLKTDDIIIFYQSEWMVKVSDSDTVTSWGDIEGNIADQTDLQGALDSKLPSSSYTASDVLSKLLTVDGSGSGLDADLLRGVHWGNVNTAIISNSDITGRDFFSSRDGVGIVEIVGISSGCVIGTDTNHDLLLRRNNVERARLTSAGLSVNGTLIGNSSASFTGTATAAPATLSTELVTKGQLDAAARPYKVYAALLSQSGTSAPTATVLENTLGGTVVWSRSSTGIYHATLSGAFITNKTICQTSSTYGGLSNYGMVIPRITGTNYIEILNILPDTKILTDGLLSSAPIEIRVYN